MSKKKIPHLALVAKPALAASSNVTPLRPPVEPEFDTSVLVGLLEDAAAVHLVIAGESYCVATLTGGNPRSRFAAAQAKGERLLRALLDEDSADPERARLARHELDAFEGLIDAQGGQHG